MTLRPRVGVLGGTFDPIHVGHLAAAKAAQQMMDLDVVRFIPSARPPHRPDSPQASDYHRIEMIRLAIASANSRWEVSDLELQRQGPSYTFDTLTALRAEGLNPLQIFFTTGADAFSEVATWHRYPDVLDQAHFVVVTRPGATIQDLRQRLPSLTPRMAMPSDVRTASTPRIFLIESITPDVSSTEIRRCAERGESLADIVTPEVAAYISQNSLYRQLPRP